MALLSFHFPPISNHCTYTLIVIELTSGYFLVKNSSMMNGSRTIALTGGNRRYYLAGIGRVQEVGLKAMLHETIRNEGF